MGFHWVFFSKPPFFGWSYACHLLIAATCRLGGFVGSPQLQVSLKTQLLEESIRIWAPESQKEGVPQMGGEMTFGNNRGCGVRQLGGCFK